MCPIILIFTSLLLNIILNYTNKCDKIYSNVQIDGFNHLKKNIINSKSLSIVILILLGALLYSNTFTSPFIFDGIAYIKDNASIRNLNDIAGIFRFWPTRFISFLSFGINYHFNKFDVFGYHLVNLAIHLINGMLLWWLVLLVFHIPAMKNKVIAGYSFSIAFLTGLIFISHPVQTQSVTYIYQRSSSLSALFYLLSLCLYLKTRLTANKTLSSVICLLFFLISAILGMFTKETMLTLPAMILLFELCLFKPSKKRNFRYIIPFLIVSFIIPFTLIATKTVYFKQAQILADKNITTPTWHYLFTQFKVLITYIRLLFFPINLNLDYDYPISKSLFELPVLISLAVLLIILVAGIRMLKPPQAQHNSMLFLMGFGILWFFITLLPESSVITLSDVINEHRLYLAMPGYALFLIAGLHYLFKRNIKLLTVIALIIIIFYSSLTYFRNIIWQDELSLWSDTVDKSPNKARGYNARGVAYSDRGQYDKAIGDFSTALSIYSKYASAYNNRGDAYNNKGEFDKAILDFTRAITINPDYADAYYNRANAYSNKKDYDKAISDYTDVLRINPKDKEAYNNRAVAYFMMKKYNEAREDAKKSQGLGYPVNPEFIKLLNPERIDPDEFE